MSIPEIDNANNIGVYLSFKKEVNTTEIIEKLWLMEKKLFAPVVNVDLHGFSFAELNSLHNLSENKYGVPEPPHTADKIFPEEIDLFLVPGIAFDKKGHRLGWGKGYYDKFFNSFQIKGKKVGLAFSFQMVESIPNESFDVPMDYVVSEKDFTKF